MGDETRDIINNAEALLKKGGGGKAKDTGAAPSTRQLVVEAEKLAGKEGSSGAGAKLLFALVGLAVVGAAVWYFLGRS